MIPQAAKRKLAQFVDVFCDQGAFARRKRREQIFAAAEKHGLSVRAHMGQLSEDRPCRPFLRFHPASFDHMDHVSNDDVIAVGCNADTVATLVPGRKLFSGHGRNIRMHGG
jgi:imidazolonepropionase